jgi:peptidoglycan/xylan/chitin deacetylase (PgdA/CDA1 family)
MRRLARIGVAVITAGAALLVLAVGGSVLLPVSAATGSAEPPTVPILVYHRFGPAVKDAMTVRTATLRGQLDYLRAHHHPVIPLRLLVGYLRGQAPAPPRGAVVITVDDGHASVFTEMRPIVSGYQIPVTLFIYPSAVSNASYAMTWAQLDQLRQTGLFDIESHTYWHPNFKVERRRLSPAAFRIFVARQFSGARTALHDRLGVDADLLAWPFGIYDDDLIDMAREAGYVAGFTIERRLVSPGDPVMALPRILVTDGLTGRQFASVLPPEGR